VRLLEAFGRFFKLHKSSGHSDSHKEAALRWTEEKPVANPTT
jgi:hypothetical protein